MGFDYEDLKKEYQDFDSFWSHKARNLSNGNFYFS